MRGKGKRCYVGVCVWVFNGMESEEDMMKQRRGRRAGHYAYLQQYRHAWRERDMMDGTTGNSLKEINFSDE